jgi:glycine cleavage system H protein
LEATPETVNQSPYADGWIMKVKVADNSSASGDLLDATAYGAEIA